MKKIALNIFALGMIGMAFTACDDAKNDAIDNMVYISEAATEPATEIILGKTGEASNTSINIRMGQKALTDTKVQLALDAATLDSYNKRNEMELALIPEKYIEFPTEVVIPAGASMIEVPIVITSFDGEKGVDYAAPIKITNADGVPTANASSKFILTFGKPLTQKVPLLRSANAMKMGPESDWSETCQDFTLEWWCRVTGINTEKNGYSKNNQAVYAFQANRELYIRFGDLIYSSGGRYLNNFLQAKYNGSQFDSGKPAEDKGLESGVWYHWALVYEGATGTTSMYKNGSYISSLTTNPGDIFEFNGLDFCAAGSYFADQFEICQIRMWRTARTAVQIQKNMKREVKYTDPNLVFYLPMNEGEGSTLHDVTGNGHDLEIGSHSSGYVNEAYGWNEYTFE